MKGLNKAGVRLNLLNPGFNYASIKNILDYLNPPQRSPKASSFFCAADVVASDELKRLVSAIAAVEADPPQTSLVLNRVGCCCCGIVDEEPQTLA